MYIHMNSFIGDNHSQAFSDPTPTPSVIERYNGTTKEFPNLVVTGIQENFHNKCA